MTVNLGYVSHLEIKFFRKDITLLTGLITDHCNTNLNLALVLRRCVAPE